MCVCKSRYILNLISTPNTLSSALDTSLAQSSFGWHTRTRIPTFEKRLKTSCKRSQGNCDAKRKKWLAYQTAVIPMRRRRDISANERHQQWWVDKTKSKKRYPVDKMISSRSNVVTADSGDFRINRVHIKMLTGNDGCSHMTSFYGNNTKPLSTLYPIKNDWATKSPGKMIVYWKQFSIMTRLSQQRWLQPQAMPT